MSQNMQGWRVVSVSLLSLGAVVAAVPASAQEMQMENELGASLRLGLELVTEPDATINFKDFASRLVWNGGVSVNDLEVTSYLEFGFDDTDGILSTRQAWAGVAGEFGSIKGGKQYRAFYDLSSGFTDIAYIGSCFFQVGCARQEAVIKYEKSLGGDARLIASGTMQNDDLDNDLFDELEAGALFTIGEMKLGAVAGFSASELADSGVALGVAVSTQLGDVTVSSSLQYAEQDYVNSSSIRESGIRTADDLVDAGFIGDDALFLNASASVDRWYAVAGLRDADNTPFFATLGYVYPVVEDAFFYAEVEASDPDTDGADTNLSLRAVFVYNFGSVNLIDATDGKE